jgi:hypothetical protein
VERVPRTPSLPRKSVVETNVTANADYALAA